MKNTATTFLLLLSVFCLLGSSANAQSTLFNEPFTSNLGQFTAGTGSNGSWQWKNACNYSNTTGHTAPGAAMFIGSGCLFGNGGLTVSGDMTSPEFFIPGSGGAFSELLTVSYVIYNECGFGGGTCYYDVLYVELSSNNGTSWTTVGNSYTMGMYNGLNGGAWRVFTYNLNSGGWGPGALKIRIRFNSLDGIANSYDGIYVDDIKVTGDALTDNINVSPTALTFQVEQGGVLPASQNIAVTTTPTTLAWTTTLTQAPAPDWVSRTPTTGTGATSVAVNILRSNLAYGTYNAMLRFQAPTAMPKDVPITYIVHQPVHVAPDADPAILKFGCKAASTIQKRVKINNTGGHFNGGSLTWTATTTAPEITLVTASGTEGQDLVFNVNASSLGEGTHLRTITITAKNSVTNVPADNSPYSLNVKIEVEPDVVVSQTKAVGATYVDFTNSYGHVYTSLQNNAGSSSYTATLHPCEFPKGLTRLRYVKRWFTFSPTSGNVNMKLYYTNTELALGGITNASLLKIWQQPTTGGAWVNRGGTADPNSNVVTATGLTSLSGVFALAAPWTPKAMNLSLGNVTFDRVSHNALLQWNTELIPNETGFIVERTTADADANWEIVGTVSQNGAAEYGFSNHIAEEGTYLYRIYGVDRDGEQFESNIFTVNAYFTPLAYTLEQNYPNPFNPTTKITFTLPENSNVRLFVMDNLGRVISELVNREMPAGRHSVDFNAAQIPSGQYFYRIVAGSFTDTKTLTVTK